MHRPWLSIPTTVLLALAVAVLVPAAVLWGVEQRLIREVQQPLVARHRQALLIVAGESLVEPLWTIDERQVRVALNRLLDEPSVRSVRLTERRPGVRPLELTRADAASAPGAGAAPVAQPLHIDIVREGESLGTLEVRFDDTALDRLIAERRSTTVQLATLQMLVASAILLLVLYRRLVQPIERLKRQASNLTGPTPAAPEVWHGDDELAQLGRHLGDVQHQLRESIQRLQTQKAELEKLALHDALTDLPNRTLFNELLQRAVAEAQRDGQRLALLFIDLDHFKTVNDAWGHGAGDRLLLEVARRLKAHLRAADVVSRHSGDEFVVLLRHPSGDDDISATADRLLRAIERAVDLDGHEANVSASIGIALMPDDGADPGTLLRHADTAMYEAKRLGRARCSFFRSELNAQMQATLQLEQELQRALAGDEFVLHYQPIVDAATGAPVGCEALIRWQHPQRGLVPPLQFVGAAEQCGLISQLGHWTVRAACAQIARWRVAGVPFGSVAVNVSALEFRHHRLVDSLIQSMADFHIAPHELVIELTESVLMTDTDTTQRIVERIHGLGLRLAVDDFGTGYSSLSYLKRLRPAKIKIDRSFVRDLPADEDDRVLARAIVQLAKAMGIIVVAEGVETEAQRDYLRGIGCDELQGYLISRPQSAEGFERFAAQPAAADAPQP